MNTFPFRIKCPALKTVGGLLVHSTFWGGFERKQSVLQLYHLMKQSIAYILNINDLIRKLWGQDAFVCKVKS